MDYKDFKKRVNKPEWFEATIKELPNKIFEFSGRYKEPDEREEKMTIKELHKVIVEMNVSFNKSFEEMNDSFTKRLDKVEESLKETNESFTKRLDKVEKSLKETNESLKKTNESFTKRLDKMEKSIDSRFDKIDARIDNLVKVNNLKE